jgi:hypothetical protein
MTGGQDKSELGGETVPSDGEGSRTSPGPFRTPEPSDGEAIER